MLISFIKRLKKKLKPDIDWHSRKMAAHQLAVNAFNKGLSTNRHLKERNYCSLKHIENESIDGCNSVGIHASGAKLCSFCRKHSNNTLSITDAFKTQPLPHSDCTCPGEHGVGFCCCYYEIIFDEEFE